LLKRSAKCFPAGSALPLMAATPLSAFAESEELCSKSRTTAKKKTFKVRRSGPGPMSGSAAALNQVPDLLPADAMELAARSVDLQQKIEARTWHRDRPPRTGDREDLFV